MYDGFQLLIVQPQMGSPLMAETMIVLWVTPVALVGPVLAMMALGTTIYDSFYAYYSTLASSLLTFLSQKHYLTFVEQRSCVKRPRIQLA